MGGAATKWEVWALWELPEMFLRRGGGGGSSLVGVVVVVRRTGTEGGLAGEEEGEAVLPCHTLWGRRATSS